MTYKPTYTNFFGENPNVAQQKMNEHIQRITGNKDLTEEDRKGQIQWLIDNHHIEVVDTNYAHPSNDKDKDGAK